jgi:Zn-dependent protease/CBS domain-containing protein
MRSQTNQRAHPWSLHLVTVADIPVRVHFTFWLLLLWIAFGQARTRGAALGEVALVLSVFACVVLHELGHALVARGFGIRTRDITLYPIGGVASLESMGTPRQELFISLAGPAVNVLIATVLGLWLQATGRGLGAETVLTGKLSYAQTLFQLNIWLAGFNLLPAFPMDGGRVLRAALALRIGKERATAVAAAIGQGLAVLMGLAGLLLGQFLLMFVALFVFLGAGAEASVQRRIAVTSGYRIRDAMITRFDVLRHGDTLESAVRHLLETHQQDFPVVHGDTVLGVLTRQQLLAALAAEGQGALVSGAMNRNVPRVPPDMDLVHAFGLLRATDGTPLLVFEGELLVGMVTLENLVEFISVARAGGVPEPSGGPAPTGGSGGGSGPSNSTGSTGSTGSNGLAAGGPGRERPVWPGGGTGPG